MEFVREGDLVLVAIDSKRRFLVRVESGKVLGTDRGFILHDAIIGVPYGSVVKTSMGVSAYVLKPLRQDFYSRGLARTTQVIYPKDAAFMVYISGIGPGSKVGEAGVGSGALTLTIASIIGREGRLYGFDVSDRALECARVNIFRAGFSDRVTLKKLDVRETLDVEEHLDAFFLDIPDPWNAVMSINRILKPSGALVIYVPTINQVEKTVLTLRELKGFIDVHVYELLLREYQVEKDAVRPETRMIGHTGYVIFARKVLNVPSYDVEVNSVQ